MPTSRRVCVVITARPSYSRIKSALVALEARPDVELQIVAAASALVIRYGRIVDQIRADGFGVAAEVPSVIDGDGLEESVLSTGVLLSGLGNVFARIKPDVVVSIADRHETIATAIAASYQHIELAHVQGGEVTGSIDDKVRNAVTQLADVHCVASEAAAARVNRMRPGAEIHVTGCPSIDIAEEAIKAGRLRDHFPTPQHIVVLQHSVTGEHDQAAEQMQATIDAIRSLNRDGLLHGEAQPTYFWPGEDAGGRAMAKVMRDAGINAIDTMEPVHFLRMLKYSTNVLVGNSSVGIRECAYLGTPVVNIGTRQKGRDRALNVVDVPHEPEAIAKAIWAQMNAPQYKQSLLYGRGYAAKRIADAIAGGYKGIGAEWRVTA